VAEGIDHGYVRMVVDEPDRAVALLGESEYLVYEREVVLLEIANQPGTLGRVLELWGQNEINVEYAYCAGGPAVDRGLIVVRVSDSERALALLED
jgi:hypothetical protein